MDHDFDHVAAALIETGARLADKGWVPATSGNFSHRLAHGEIAITSSGADKGRLQKENIMRVDQHGNSLDGRRPSAETLLHTQLYQRFPRIQAILHTHSVNATVISQLRRNGFSLNNYELLKALPGLDSHECELFIPVLANDQDISRLSREVEKFLDQPHLHAYLIEGHGLYTWAESVQQAYIQVEALEFMFTCELTKMRMNP